jgi:hypothetical protein
MLMTFGVSCAMGPPTTSSPHQTSSRVGPTSAHWAAALTAPLALPRLYATSLATLIHRATTPAAAFVAMALTTAFRSALRGLVPVDKTLTNLGFCIGRRQKLGLRNSFVSFEQILPC